MGFGSYDESEQENHDVGTSDSEGESVDIHESTHDGELTFDSGASTDDMLDQLDAIKSDAQDG